MKNIILLGLIMLIGLSAAYQQSTTVDVGDSISAGQASDQTEAEELLGQAEDEIGAGESQGNDMSQARTHYDIAQRAYSEGDYEAAKVHAQESVNAAVQAGAYVEETGPETEPSGAVIQEQVQTGKEKGTSAQIQAMVQEQQGGAIAIPQGEVVQIMAQNRMVQVDNESIPLNSTLRLKLMVQNQEHVLAFNGSGGNEIEIEEQGVKVRTRENLMLSNNQMVAGDANILIFPGAIQQKLKLNNMEQARLHVENGVPYYQVNGTKTGKLLGLIDVELQVQAQIQAQNGNVENEQGPWWAFLVTSQ
jgi:hypothetical protein